MAGNSEIISILAAGISFKRLLRPYMISCVFISTMSFVLAAYVIPHGTVIRQNFESLYKNNKKNTSAENVQLQVDKGVIAYIQHYDNRMKRGYGFCLDKFENKKLVSHMTASEIQYDTISESKYHWKVQNWKIREMRGMKETIISGIQRDTVIQMEPIDLVYSKGQQETFTSPELSDLETNKQRFKQCRKVSGRIPQKNSYKFCFFYTDHNRGFAIIKKEEGRNGHVFRIRISTEFPIYYATNHLCYICDQCRYTSDTCSMGSQYIVCYCSMVLLQTST